MRDPSDVFVRAADGRDYWGLYGAAGALIAAPTGRVLLQLRSEWTHSGGTWGIPGGAVRLDEGPVRGSLREFSEEVRVGENFRRDALEPVSTWVADRGGWTYTTVILRADAEFPASVGNPESDDIRWVAISQVTSLALHPGFAAAWQTLREAVNVRPVIVGVDSVPLGGLRAAALGMPGDRWFPRVVSAGVAVACDGPVIWVGPGGRQMDRVAEAAADFIGPFSSVEELL